MVRAINVKNEMEQTFDCIDGIEILEEECLEHLVLFFDRKCKGQKFLDFYNKNSINEKKLEMNKYGVHYIKIFYLYANEFLEKYNKILSRKKNCSQCGRVLGFQQMLNEMKKKSNCPDKTTKTFKRECLLGAFASAVLPLFPDVQERKREIIEDLKQKDGESWAMGETLERICHILGNLNEDQLKNLEDIARKNLKTGC